MAPGTNSRKPVWNKPLSTQGCFHQDIFSRFEEKPHNPQERYCNEIEPCKFLQTVGLKPTRAIDDAYKKQKAEHGFIPEEPILQLRIKVEARIVPEMSSPPPEYELCPDIIHVESDDDKPLERDDEDPKRREPDPETARNRVPSHGDRVESPSATVDPVDGAGEQAATELDEDTQPQETLLYDP